MKLYRFCGPYEFSKPFTKSFKTDDEALRYASEMTDGPELASVCLQVEDKWLYWDIYKECWVYEESVSINITNNSINIPHYA